MARKLQERIDPVWLADAITAEVRKKLDGCSGINIAYGPLPDRTVELLREYFTVARQEFGPYWHFEA